jgi:thiol-disulfide isomerase/thioredoxin
MTDTDPTPITPEPPAIHPERRAAMLAVGAIATVFGAGAAWWVGKSNKKVDASDELHSLWALEWSAPDGTMLRMQNLRGKPLLINFWATWCPPCVEELPLINRFYLENRAKGWQVLGLAVDKLDSVQSFLARQPLDFPIGMAGLAGADLGRNLGNISGGLPFSVVFSGAGGVLHRKMGRLSPADLSSWSSLK